jgi:hypothetical protein
MVGRELSQAMLPLVEDGQVAESLAVGRKLFKLPTHFAGERELMEHMLAKKNWVSLYLSLVVLGQREGDLESFRETLGRLAQSRNPYVKAEASRLAHMARREA